MAQKIWNNCEKKEMDSEFSNAFSTTRNNLKLFIGCRVVRGPHWIWDRQDGN